MPRDPRQYARRVAPDTRHQTPDTRHHYPLLRRPALTTDRARVDSRQAIGVDRGFGHVSTEAPAEQGAATMVHEFPLPQWDRWHPTPAIVKGGGPERVATEEPPEDWKPTPLLGFGAAVAAEAEPLTWDGDGA